MKERRMLTEWLSDHLFLILALSVLNSRVAPRTENVKNSVNCDLSVKRINQIILPRLNIGTDSFLSVWTISWVNQTSKLLQSFNFSKSEVFLDCSVYDSEGESSCLDNSVQSLLVPHVATLSTLLVFIKFYRLTALLGSRPYYFSPEYEAKYYSSKQFNRIQIMSWVAEARLGLILPGIKLTYRLLQKCIQLKFIY